MNITKSRLYRRKTPKQGQLFAQVSMIKALIESSTCSQQ